MTFITRELLREFGRKYLMVYLRYDLAGCPKGRGVRDCAVRFAGRGRPPVVGRSGLSEEAPQDRGLEFGRKYLMVCPSV